MSLSPMSWRSRLDEELPSSSFRALSAQPGRVVKELPLMRALRGQWRQLCDDRSSAEVIRRWRLEHPVLPEGPGLAELAVQIRAGSAGEACDVADARLAVLITLAQQSRSGSQSEQADRSGRSEQPDGLDQGSRPRQSGQPGQPGQLAAHLLLHLFEGRIINLIASQVRSTGAESVETEAQVVSGFWQALMSYPLPRRPRRVAANLAMDTLRLSRKNWSFTRGTRRVDGELAVREVEVSDARADELAHRAVEHDSSPTLLGLQLLADALAHDAINREEARLLVWLYVPLPGQPGDARAAAEHLGISQVAVRQRASRSMRKVIDYVRTNEAINDQTLPHHRRRPVAPASSRPIRLGALIPDLMAAA